MQKTLSFAQLNTRPGPIDNSDLQAANADLVRPYCVEGDHFILVPDCVWSQLMSWYGGGPSFPRFVVSVGPGGGSVCVDGRGEEGPRDGCQLEVDVWPVPLSVAFLPGDGPAKPGPPLSSFSVRLCVQTPWRAVFASLLQVQRMLREGPRVLQWPDAEPLAVLMARAAAGLVPSDYRLHVQVCIYIYIYVCVQGAGRRAPSTAAA